MPIRSFHKGNIVACAAYFALSVDSRFVRRIRRTLSFFSGCNIFPVENLRDIFSTAWMSLSKEANSLVSVNFLNFDDLLI